MLLELFPPRSRRTSRELAVTRHRGISAISHVECNLPSNLIPRRSAFSPVSVTSLGRDSISIWRKFASISLTFRRWNMREIIWQYSLVATPFSHDDSSNSFVPTRANKYVYMYKINMIIKVYLNSKQMENKPFMYAVRHLLFPLHSIFLSWLTQLH